MLNGREPDGSLAHARALHYGDGVFRTMLVHAGQVVDWSRQWHKLLADCQRLGLNPPELDVLEAELQLLASGQMRCVLKLILSRRTTGRGYIPKSNDCDRLLLRSAAPEYPAHFWTQGIAVTRSSVTLSSQPLLAGVKHLNRLEQVLASHDWPEGVQESLQCNERGEPICGTRTNLFWVDEGTLMTPDLGQCGVSGMMRQKILDLQTGRGTTIQVRNVSWQVLEQADEVFLCNSLIGLWPVQQIGRLQRPAPGPLTLDCLRELRHPGIPIC